MKKDAFKKCDQFTPYNYFTKSSIISIPVSCCISGQTGSASVDRKYLSPLASGRCQRPVKQRNEAKTNIHYGILRDLQ